MRTLKKSLCLVLALVMVLGLCMIGANATYANYTDNKKINYADAVEVLTGLNVIEGYPDGEFKPAENVTRAEAAAMITRMMLGREKADKLPIGDVKFNDVPETNWAAKYISFCANKGIIVGVGNGNFEPSRNVTGTELACMLLRALGYGTMGEYEGKGWDINAVADALYYKVFDDSEVTDFSQPATREETALYVFNTLWVDLVGWDVDLNYYRDKGYSFADSVYFLEKVEYAQVMENQATGNTYTVISYVNDKNKTVEINLDIETPVELIAHEVTAYVKTDKEYKDKDNNYYYEAYLVHDDSTTIKAGGYYWTDMYKALVAESKANKTASLDFDVWINYVYEADADTATMSFDMNGANGNTAALLKGDEIDYTSFSEIVLDSDGAPLAYMVTSYTVDQVKKITDDGIILKNDLFGYEVYDPELAYEGIAKGDYVTVQPVGDLCYLYPTTTEEINVYERSVYVDYGPYGDAFYSFMWFNFYSVSTNGFSYNAISVPDTDDAWTIAAGDKVLFYKDYYGAYFATKILERGILQGVVFVNVAYTKNVKDEYGEDDTTVYVQAVTEEGKEVIYPLKSSLYKTAADAPKGVYKVYTDSKDEATLEAVGGVLQKEDGKSSYVTKDGGIYYVNSDTNVIYVTDEKKDMTVKVSNGLATGAYDVYGYWTGTSTYNMKSIWIDADETGKTAPASTGSYMYVFGKASSGYYCNNGGSMVVNDETTYYFTVYVDGVKSSSTFISNENLKYNMVKGGFYTYSVDENNIYTLEAVAADDLKVNVGTKAVTLEKGDIHNGKLYYDADGIAITADVLNVGKPNDGKKYFTLDTIEDIEAFLDDGGTVTVEFMAKKSGSNWVPFGTIYVVDATAPVE